MPPIPVVLVHEDALGIAVLLRVLQREALGITGTIRYMVFFLIDLKSRASRSRGLLSTMAVIKAMRRAIESTVDEGIAIVPSPCVHRVAGPAPFFSSMQIVRCHGRRADAKPYLVHWNSDPP